MCFYADLHIHSKYSRATSGDCDLEGISGWAPKKGLTVIGTGDFTHPQWIEEIADKLEPAEPGLFKLKSDLARAVSRGLPPALRHETRFILSAEISTIYKRGDKTRKVHHLILSPGLDEARRMNKALAKIGNIASDGRPILGLDSRDLFEIVLEAGEDNILIPAHIWTPWFSVLGSKSGFDSIEECYGDLSSRIFALETGLSSDPAMNWRLSKLDRYRLVSNSDAHSPGKLGREANVFECGLDYFAMRKALETGEGYGGTIEFFPEEGKYHLDGHRKCEVRLDPDETKERDGLCPVCGKSVTVGVMNRVMELADRPEGARPAGAAGFVSLIPLNEVIGETIGVGPQSKSVMKIYDALVNKLGPELFVLREAPLDDVGRHGGAALREALSRMREGRVIRDAGYDGEYGVIRLFEKDELEIKGRGGLFDLSEAEKEDRIPRKPSPKKSVAQTKTTESKPEATIDLNLPACLRGLDPDQARAAMTVKGPLIITAGPGTGKTSTLTRRIAHLVLDHKVPAAECLAITFSRRAAAEMQSRLKDLIPPGAGAPLVTTFHGLGLAILSEHSSRAGLGRRIGIAPESERVQAVASTLGIKEGRAKKLLGEISRCKRQGTLPDPGSDIARAYDALEDWLRSRSLLDFDDLIARAVSFLESDPGAAEMYRRRFTHVSVDEYQDVDESMYRLIRLLAPGNANLAVIGDPDQSIYAFRGADHRFFLRFTEDYPGAATARLTRNYRSAPVILEASGQVIANSEIAIERGLTPAVADPALIEIHESASEKAEAEFVVSAVERFLGGHSFFSLDSGRGDAGGELCIGFSDVAVLYRTEAQGDALVEALARAGMTYQRRSHARVAERPEARAILDAMMKLSGKGTVAGRLLQVAAEIKGEGGIEAVMETLQPLAVRAGDDLSAFLLAAEMETEADALDPRAERISLLTLHAAKGLEFDVVFIVGCEDGLIPLRFGKGEEANLEEERRLFYVGMTRAKRRLVLCRAKKRMRHGKPTAMKPSPYLAEIESRLLQKIDGKGPRGKPAPGATQLKLF